jgi:hypothetical protein
MQVAAAAAGLLFLSACSKSNDSVKTSTPPFQVGQTVSSTTPLSGAVKGTMVSGQTYTLGGDISVNAGDTLYMQSGVTLKIPGKYNIIVHGSFISAGTETAPNWITSGTPHQDQAFSSIAASLTGDPAFAGQWYGINCDTTCPLFVMKWTHIEFGGATFGAAPIAGTTSGTASYLIFFQNPKGIFDLEDSWIYGSVDDAVRVTDGQINIMRNTFEKTGSNNGESVNVKSGTVGDIAYNVFVGSATNGTKVSNAGATAIQCNVHVYNNTYVDCGFRQSSTSGHGGSINLEKGAQALIYNNLIVNCKIGLRIVSTADTTNAKYGNTYFYGDSLAVANEFYSVGDVTHPQTTDIPTPSTYIPGYLEGIAYDGSAVVGKNNPSFKNFTLPNTAYEATNWATGFDFHLGTSSPALGKGYTSFAASALVKLDANFGATEITAPGGDIGAYQSSGVGNKH